MRIKGIIRPVIGLQLFCIYAFACWLAFNQPMHVDEALTYRHFVSTGWKMAVSTYPFPNNHVFYSLLATGFTKLPLDPLIGMRLLSLMSGVLNGILMYRILRLKANKEWSIIGTVLWGTSLTGLQYMTQARGYGIQLTFLLVALYSVFQLINVKPKCDCNKDWVFWLALTVSASLGFFTIPTFLFPGLSLGGLLILGLVNRKGVRFPWVQISILVVFTVALTLLFYTPIFIYSGYESLINNQWIEERKFINLTSSQVSGFFVDMLVYLGPALVCFLSFFVLTREKGQELIVKWLLPVFLILPLCYVIVSASLPFPRTFGYLSAIMSIAIVWRVRLSNDYIKALFVLLTTSSLIFTYYNLIPNKNNPTTVAQQILQAPVMAKIDTIYTNGWSNCGQMLDFYSWYKGSGPVVQNIYSEDFNMWLKTKKRIYVLSEIKHELMGCEPIVMFENQSVFYCH